MQTTTLALLSATTVGTLGTIVALPVDQTRAAAILRKARKRVCRAQRRMRHKTDSSAVGMEPSVATSEEISMTRSTSTTFTSSASSTSTAATRSSTASTPSDLTAYTSPSRGDDSDSVPSPSLPSLSPSQRTPYRPQPSIAITCPDGYFYNLDLSTPVWVCVSPISPSSLMSPKEGLGLEMRGLSLGEAMKVEMR